MGQKQKYSITRTYLIYTGVTVVFFILSFAGYLIWNEISRYHNNIEEKKEMYIHGQKRLIKSQVDLCVRFIEYEKENAKYLYQRPLEELQKTILEQIAKIRFQNNRYIFVVSYDGTTLMNDVQRNLIGKNQWEITDPNGIKIVQEERKAVENPEGDFIYYSWYKPNADKPSPKISFVKGVPEWKWMVGMGIYLEDVERIIHDEKEYLRNRLLKHVLVTIVILAIIGLLFFYISRYVASKTQNSFNTFSRVFKEAAEKSTRIDLDKLHFTEFESPAISANQMLNKLKKASDELHQINQELEERVRERTAEIERQKEELLAQADELENLSVVARETTNAVMIMDPGGNIEWINEGFEKMYGFNLHELYDLRGHNIKDATGNEQLKVLIEDWIGSTEPLHYEAPFETKSGEMIWSHTTISPVMDNNGKIRKLVVIDSDISKLKMAEEEILQKNKGITSSIAYAKRIQDALFPPIENFKKYFEQSFIYHKPKEIVSGDFYWFTEEQGKIIVAAADCTGHGVPGAFLSLIGISFLNKIVMENKNTSPDQILNELKKNLVLSLHMLDKNRESSDGMDISIVSLDLSSKQLEYSGAMNPVYILRDNEIIELHPDKMPMGVYEFIHQLYQKQSFAVQSGDIIYMFSDGYADQFGGTQGKKMKYDAFKEYLVKVSRYPFNEQERLLNTYLIEWKGSLEQVDDILIIAFKIV